MQDIISILGEQFKRVGVQISLQEDIAAETSDLTIPLVESQTHVTPADVVGILSLFPMKPFAASKASDKA